MPLVWTACSYMMMGLVNPVLQQGVDWPWFVVSQFVFGVVAGAGRAAASAMAARWRRGLLGGLVGGLLMPLPAVLWSLATGHGIWYPVNLLAGMAVPGMGHLPLEALEQFHADWFAIAVGIHAGMSAAFGVVYGLLLPRLPADPGRRGLGRTGAAAAVDRHQLWPDGRGQSACCNSESIGRGSWFRSSCLAWWRRLSCCVRRWCTFRRPGAGPTAWPRLSKELERVKSRGKSCETRPRQRATAAGMARAVWRSLVAGCDLPGTARSQAATRQPVSPTGLEAVRASIVPVVMVPTASWAPARR